MNEIYIINYTINYGDYEHHGPFNDCFFKSEQLAKEYCNKKNENRDGKHYFYEEVYEGDVNEC